MIKPLRSAHRTAFSILAVILPALMLAGLGERHPGRERSTRPSLVGPSLQSMNGGLKLQIDGHVLRAVATDKFNAPETLVYVSGHGTLDSDALLLGVLDPKALNAYKLPKSSLGARFVIFYSPALSSVIDNAEVAGAR